MSGNRQIRTTSHRRRAVGRQFCKRLMATQKDWKTRKALQDLPPQDRILLGLSAMELLERKLRAK